MSEQYVNSFNGLGAPTLADDRPGDVPPPPATAPLVAPVLPSLPGQPSPAATGPAPEVSASAPVAPAPPPPSAVPAIPPAATPAPPTLAPSTPAPSTPAPSTPAPLATAAAVPTLPPVGAPPAAVPTAPAPVPASLATMSDPLAPAGPGASSATGLVDAPTLPPVGSPTREPATAESEPSVQEKLGLPPTTGNTAPSEIPEWKRRQNSKGRKLAKRLFSLALVGGLAAGGYFGYQAFEADGTDDADAPAESDAANGADGAAEGGAIAETLQDARDVTAAIDGKVVDIELIEPGAEAEIAPGSLDDASFSYSWSSVGGVPMEIQIDGVTNNYEIRSPSLTMRRVGSDIWATPDPADGWNLSSVPGQAEQSFLGVDRFVTDDVVVPAFLSPFVISDAVDADGIRTIAIDDQAFAAGAASERTNWFNTWALDPAVTNTEPVTIALANNSDGLVQSVTVSAPTSAGLTTYQLLEIFEGQMPIDAPSLADGSALPANEVSVDLGE